MKLPANKLRKVIREEIGKVLNEQGPGYSETGFHSGSKKMGWGELGDHIDGVVGKTIQDVELMGRDHVEITFQDGSKISFGTDGTVFYDR